MGRQFELKRVADCMIDLYACGAVLSRATAAVQQGKENADVEVELAKIYVDEAVGRLNENIRQIQRLITATCYMQAYKGLIALRNVRIPFWRDLDLVQIR